MFDLGGTSCLVLTGSSVLALSRVGVFAANFKAFRVASLAAAIRLLWRLLLRIDR